MRKVLRWEPDLSPEVIELDLSSLGDDLAIPLSPPAEIVDLNSWLERRAGEINAHFAQWSTVIQTDIVGEYPRTQIVIHFLVDGRSDRHGATAIDVFDLDGQPNEELLNPTWLDEELAFTGLSSSARQNLQADDSDGVVWLQRPGTFS